MLVQAIPSWADGVTGDVGCGNDCADPARVFVKKKPIKEIVRDVKVSRNTVRKVIRSGATAFSYERRVQPRRQLGAWTAELERMLAANDAKSRRERLTLRRIYEDLADLGYGGGYDAVRRYAKAWRRRRSSSVAQAYVPLVFSPGEAYQFDWSHEYVVLAGVTTKVKDERNAFIICGCATAGCSSFAPRESQGRRIRRRCSTPMTGRSGSSTGPAGGGSTVT